MPKPKKSVREWWTAVLRGDRLVPSRGCQRDVVVIGEPIEKTSTREPHRQLTANLGDRLLLCGPNWDQCAIARVKSIRIDGWTATMFVELGAGAVNDGSVQCMRMCKARRESNIEATGGATDSVRADDGTNTVTARSA